MKLDPKLTLPEWWEIVATCRGDNFAFYESETKRRLTRFTNAIDKLELAVQKAQLARNKRKRTRSVYARQIR